MCVSSFSFHITLEHKFTLTVSLSLSPTPSFFFSLTHKHRTCTSSRNKSFKDGAPRRDRNAGDDTTDDTPTGDLSEGGEGAEGGEEGEEGDKHPLRLRDKVRDKKGRSNFRGKATKAARGKHKHHRVGPQ